MKKVNAKYFLNSNKQHLARGHFFTIMFFSFLIFQNCAQINFSPSINKLQGIGQILPDGTVLDAYIQSPPQVNNKLDILFMVNSSASLQAVIPSIVQGISSFVGELPNNSDFQISVIPSHSPRSVATSGVLFGANGVAVLSSSTLALADMQTNLTATFSSLPSASVSDEGTEEEGLASIFTSIDSGHLQQNRSHGFFRSDSSLAVVFIANEADVCGEPDSNPMTDSDWSAAKATQVLDCQAPLIDANSVLASLRNLQGDRPLLVSGVLYPSKSQQAGSNEKEYGWGYVETVMAANGCMDPTTCEAIIDMNLDSAGVKNGLSAIGNLMQHKFNFVYDFNLSHEPKSVSCIHIKVDGQDSQFEYNAALNSVHIDHPGVSGSQISINYCI